MSIPEQISDSLPVHSGLDNAELSHAARARIAEALHAAKSDSTRRNYSNDWNRFTTWCKHAGRAPLPAEPVTIAEYLAESAAEVTTSGERAFALSTLRRWKSSINYFHRMTGHAPPCNNEHVREMFAGLTRLYAVERPRPPRKRDALLLKQLRSIVTTSREGAQSWRTRVRERRDTAILLIGWGAAMRRSEVTALVPADFEPRDVPGVGHDEPTGFTLLVRRSKTDQTGLGQIKVLAPGKDLTSCAPCALIRWLEVLAAWSGDERVGLMREFSRPDDHDGHICTAERFTELLGQLDPEEPLIRSISRTGRIGRTTPDPVIVHHVVRQRAAAAGWDADAVDGLGGHSLRAGFVTEGLRQGQSPHAIKQQTGHKSEVTLYGYGRHITAWDNNAATEIGM